VSAHIALRETTVGSVLASAELAEFPRVVGDLHTVVSSATHDSRRVRPRGLFCCVRGARADGHDYAAAAVAAGATALVVDHELDLPVTQIVVNDVRIAMGPLCAALYGHPARRLTVVGITGTNGKTTTAHLLAHILRSVGQPVAVLGTLSGAFTTPEAPDLQEHLAALAQGGVTAVVMEVSSHALALHRVDGMQFDLAVFTNLGRDHLDLHGTMEQYLAAKERLFTADLASAGVVNLDDPAGRVIAERAAIEITGYSLGELAQIEVHADRHSYRWRGCKVSVPIGASFNVTNSLAAATAAAVLGIDPADVAAALATAPAVPGRFEPVEEGQSFHVIVDFAHTPDGLGAVLGAARSAAGSHRVIAVFGCGGDRDRTKRPRMGEVAAGAADLVVVTSDNPRSEEPRAIIGEILAGVPADLLPNVLVEPDRALAMEAAFRIARPGDVVVVAGKGHEATQTIGDQVLQFDDRAVARRILGGLR